MNPGSDREPLRVDVSSLLLEWAIQRSGRGYDYLTARFPGLAHWIQGTERPTLRQVESFAAATYTPVGYLFLQEPPEESLPLPDLRTVRDEGLEIPSPNLLDTVFESQIRQDWYRAWAATQPLPRLPFVGSVSIERAPSEVAQRIKDATAFVVPASQAYGSWSAAVTGLADALGEAGILVMINGVVGTNTHRPLDPNEFRGFTLVDNAAPLIFVNGADAKAAQLFTLAHETAHVWLGQSGIDNSLPGGSNLRDLERWCNSVAAEFLVPTADIEIVYNRHAQLNSEMDRLARRYRVSRLVVLTRLQEIGSISWDVYRATYHEEIERAIEEGPAQSGGNFYANLSQRVGKRFLRALVSTTLSGETLYSDAFRMLGIKKQSVFDQIVENVA